VSLEPVHPPEVAAPLLGVSERTLRLIRLRDVIDRVSLKRSAIYDRIERGEFPRPRKLSACAVAWVESEVNDWINGLPTTAETGSQ
jgi:prophage regulatory protein